MLTLTRAEFEDAALTLGFKLGTLRVWKHRGKIPADAKLRLVCLFDQSFEIIDEPKPPKPAGLTLAMQAARFIK